ncbi:MAG TPA: PAS domain S-box protein [Thermodesulfobacteriota bacterium]|nr:PAS domain S-box protein [Thermodesulfobacteriota bacterium]
MVQKIRKSISLKWIICFTFLATVPLAIASFSIIEVYEKDLKKSIIEIEKGKAQIVVEATNAFFEKVLNKLLSLSSEKIPWKGSRPFISKDHFQSLFDKNEYLVGLTLLDKKGEELLEVSKYKGLGPSDLKNQSKSEMLRVVSRGQIYWGKSYFTTEGVPTIVIAVPTEEYTGGPSAVLSARIELRYLWNLLPQTSIGKEGSTYVVDREGDLVAHSDRERYYLELDNIRHLPMITQLIQGKERSVEFKREGGKKYLAVYKPIEKMGWGVVVQVPVEEAYEPIRRAAKTALKWVLVVVSGTTVLSLLLTRKLRQSQEALKEAEAKYRGIFEKSKDMVYITSVDQKLADVNRAGVDLFGYGSKEEMMQVNTRDAFFYPEDRERFRNAITKEGFVKDFEVKLKKKDGAPIDVLITAHARKDVSGNLVGYEGIIKDISDRRRMEEEVRNSEERYRAILENIEEGYYEVDLAGNFTFFNDSTCQIFGYSREELMHMKDRQYTDQETTRKLFQAFNEVHRTGKPGRGFDWGITRKDGSKRYIDTSISLRKDASGKPVGFKGIIQDITDRKRIEEQLFQAEKLRAVGEMASGVAHEFNNTLAVILGNTQLLLHTAKDQESKEFLRIIEQVAKDSSQTVRRLQDFTRTPVSQELSRIDINAILRDSIEITKPRWKDEAQSRGVGIEIVSNLEDIPLASGNAPELREVITNMIFNAIEAMPKGGKIEIRTFKKRRDIHIQISDTGVGIPGEVKKKIFEPFFTTKPFSNTGLGLSMSYGIVKRFGGEIKVESEVGQGTIFTITLPIGEEGKEEAVDSRPIKKGIRIRILVIDDEEFVRNVLSRTLAQADHQVTLAEDGRKGVELFKEGKFDIVLTDLGMPGMSGWEVCRMIKEMSPHTPVGMITGWGDERNRSKMEEYGLDFLISKPFDLAQILNVVAETMESRKE